MSIIKSPFLLFNSGTSELGVFNTLNEFQTTSKKILNSGYFGNLVIVDRDGQGYDFSNVVKTGFNGWIRGWNPILKGTQIKVDFTLSTKKQYHLPELIDLVTEKLAKRIYEAIVGIEEIRQGVKTSKNIAELINNLRQIN
jgi:hypothetical protein